MTSAVFSVGLTGGVGSGKSTIASMLSARGAGVVDADAISYELTQAGGAAIEPLRVSFSEHAIAPDGSLDRDRMRAVAFSDPAARTRLEALLHPLIRNGMRERTAALAADGCPYILLVVPLLVESGTWRASVDRVLLIDCSEATQINRVCARPGMDESAARQIMQAQASRQQRLAVADDVLMNEAPLAEIESQIERLHQQYLRRQGRTQ